MVTTVDAPRVYLPRPLEHQLEILTDPARNKVVICGRRWGKTMLGLIAVIEGHGPIVGGYRGALEGGTIWWVAPSFPIAVLIWRDLKKALHGAWVEKSETERRIVLPGGGSVTVKSADNPDALRGAGLDGVVFDEAAFAKQEAWTEGLRPALADHQGWAIFLSTPSGQNWLYELYELAAARDGWARWQQPTSRNPKVPPSELEAAREELGPYAYSQEFEAQFVTPGGGLFKAEWFEHEYEALADGYYLVPGESTPVHLDHMTRFATVDLATSIKTTADYSVVMSCAVMRDGRMLILDVDRARREGPDLIPAIRAQIEKWRLGVAYVERAGFQLSLIQQAQRDGLPVRELVPDRDKVARALPATAAMEGGRVLLPKAAPWRRDLEAEVLAFPAGAHDDITDCLAYAVEAATSVVRLRAKPPSIPEVRGWRDELAGLLPSEPASQVLRPWLGDGHLN